MFRSLKATSVESLSGISRASISLELSCRKSLHSVLSIVTMPLPLCSPRVCWLLLFWLLSIVYHRYLKDWTVGISVFMYLIILTGSVSPVVCRCSVFALLTLSPFFSMHLLHLSSLTSIISSRIEQHQVVCEQHCPWCSVLNLFRVSHL